MQKLIVKRKFIEESEQPDDWLDGSLEDDGVDLNEWAFWRGFYNDN